MRSLFKSDRSLSSWLDFLLGEQKRFFTSIELTLKKIPNGFYKRYRQWGLPIVSGEIESSHRYITQKRLKIPGETWHPKTLNPMLALRVIRVNDWWDDFWQTYTCSHKLLIA